MEYDNENEMFRLAIDLVNQSSRNIFLTGKAGTGKTTFLKYIRDHSNKQMAVVAPTGVAAINAGGVTIHSFFQLPFSPFIPEAGTGMGEGEVTNRHNLVSRLRLNGDKRKVLQELELLIIDEISMVRCDTIDAIDTVLRFVRQKPLQLFGGVQILFIGDMFQLPPVIKEQEWKYLSEYYDSQYFFDSRSVREQPPVYIEFNKIYRQRDDEFINLLNQVRNNALDASGIQLLDSRYQPDAADRKQEGMIILTTHNEKARTINSEEIAKLRGRLYSYRAQIQDDFSSNAHPADEVLQLKVGAQVMFIKNDLDKSKRYFNGKLGTVASLDHEKIIVQCKDDESEIEVKREKWDNIRYSLNKSSRKLEEEVLGSFTQYPLRLAWAITIHKSQGLTFEKAIIDAGAAFAAGQVYVALSRCTNIGGLYLQSRVRSNGIFSDPRIVQFSERSASASQLTQELEAGKQAYQQEILFSLFDFNDSLSTCKDVMGYVTENASSFNSETPAWLQLFFDRLDALQTVSIRFRQQLLQLLSLSPVLDENAGLQSRVVAAVTHFVDKLEQAIHELTQSPAVTDSGIHAKEYNDALREIFSQLSLKIFLMEGSRSGFDLDAFQKRKREFVIPFFSVNSYAGASVVKSVSPHPDLYQQLRKLRDGICARKNLPIYIVAGSKTLDELATFLPQTLEQLEKISGFGPAKIEAYGQAFLDIIIDYCSDRKLASTIGEKMKKGRSAPKKNNTKEETLRMYREGKTISEIVAVRGLALSTIESHLAFYVEEGKLSVGEFLAPARLAKIEPVILEFPAETMSELRKRFGNDVSFTELRFVFAGLKATNRLSA